MALSSVLLRSQTLLSSARSINFSPSNPDKNAEKLPVDVQVSIIITIVCLILPFIIILKPFGFIHTMISIVKMLWVRKCNRAKVNHEQSSDMTISDKQDEAYIKAESAQKKDDHNSFEIALQTSSCANLSNDGTQPFPDPVRSQQTPPFHRRPILPEIYLNALTSLELHRTVDSGINIDPVSAAQIQFDPASTAFGLAPEKHKSPFNDANHKMKERDEFNDDDCSCQRGTHLSRKTPVLADIELVEENVVWIPTADGILLPEVTLEEDC